MELNNRQLAILYGMLLGDAYLQKTGSHNARLRLEHSLKQRALMDWKFEETKHIYKYVRLQSYAYPFLGELQQQFYDKDGTKKMPDNLVKIVANPITIAVWYMDDGYYDQRDKSAHFYLQAFGAANIKRLIDAFMVQYSLECKACCRPDRKACQLNFRREEKDKLLKLIEPHLIEEMKYKLPLDPVTTDSASWRMR